MGDPGILTEAVTGLWTDGMDRLLYTSGPYVVTGCVRPRRYVRETCVR